MSVVAWDGKTLAADTQSTSSGMRMRCHKMAVSNGVVLAWIGDYEVGLMLAKWWAAGADPEKWPAVQSNPDRWSRLIVATKDDCSTYEQLPVALIVHDKFMAWGSGRDFAMGAMEMGASAERAVEVACRWDTSCGLPAECCALV